VHSQTLPVAAALQYKPFLREWRGLPGVLGTLGWWVRLPLHACTTVPFCQSSRNSRRWCVHVDFESRIFMSL
jgi:hypothetical protein